MESGELALGHAAVLQLCWRRQLVSSSAFPFTDPVDLGWPCWSSRAFPFAYAVGSAGYRNGSHCLHLGHRRMLGAATRVETLAMAK